MLAWMYTRDGREHGPVPTHRLKHLARTGELRPDDLVRADGPDGGPGTHYAISDDGRLFSNSPRGDVPGQVHELSPSTEQATGYRFAYLYRPGQRRKNVRLHQLVAAAFVPNPLGHKLVLHSDGNPANNKADNLRWGSHRDNAADARRHGTLPVGERHPATRAKNIQIAAIRFCSAVGLPVTGIAGEVGLGPEHALAVAAGRNWPTVPSGKQIRAAVQKLLDEHNAASATAA